jgi:HAMP domain-containing protein
MTLGRSFLLWLLGVLVVTLVLVSALVLWHERQILEDELESRAELLAQVLALAAADGGSPEYLKVFSMTDVRAGEVRDSSGRVLWRFGPSPNEIEVLDTSLKRVERTVAVSQGVWGDEDSVSVVLLISRARVRAYLAAAAARLLAGLAIALILALVVGLVLVDRVVAPLNQLADWVRAFDPDRPAELLEGGPTTEVRDLARSFGDMAERLAEQRRSLVTSERRFRELFTASPTPLLRLDSDLSLRDRTVSWPRSSFVSPGQVVTSRRDIWLPSTTSLIGSDAWENGGGAPLMQWSTGLRWSTTRARCSSPITPSSRTRRRLLAILLIASRVMPPGSGGPTMVAGCSIAH